METRWLSIDGQELKPQQGPLYDILWTLTLPPSPANQSRKLLFHAVSPSRTNDGYLVRYLPQYRVQAQAAIACLLNRPTVNLIGPNCLPITSKEPAIPLPSVSSSQLCYMEAIEQWIRARFHTALPTRQSLASNITRFSIYPITLRSSLSPSAHKLLSWLATLIQKFQDTAWDRWWYCNGVEQ